MPTKANKKPAKSSKVLKSKSARAGRGPSIRRKLRSIAFFAPNGSSVYVNMLLGLRKELVNRGIDVHVGWRYMNALEMAQFCDVFRPEILLEIDRTRNNAEGVPASVSHVAWIQDWRSVGVDEVQMSSNRLGGSDLYLFCTQPEAVGVDASGLSNWTLLLQATDPEIYMPEKLSPISDFSLLGYIPPKHRLEIYDQALEADLIGGGMLLGGVDLGTVGQLVQAMADRGLTWNAYNARAAHRFMNQYVYDKIGQGRGLQHMMFGGFARMKSTLAPPDRCVIPDELLYGIENLLMRAMGRKGIVDAALTVSDSIRIFGLGEWETYPEYAPYFRGPLKTEDAVRRMYLTSKINLHNAMSQMHSRALDCMAAGAVVFVNRIYDNNAETPECLRGFFEPTRHYFEYDEDLPEVAREVLADGALRRRVGRDARDAVLAAHTWGHRVDQLLSDFAHM